ncbi:flagellar biosynthesis protein FlhA [Caballeronia sp. LZ035]|uniref:flagellar biosynthesis protein FlhA n=1 Tax=Caballeronia sp. LZ035 TaxID=3038568 RepID=UPI002863F951|nr:flagellar biosynthesis protein FlhA [Caballeronia sp. LZ035]MDR5760149.1 flagellar biosynthesis protein FlhA [Caballeronia sp. LZ035]
MSASTSSRLHALPGLLARYAHVALAAGFICVIALLILPVPPFLLDLFIGLSFCASFVMLFSSIYVSRAADLPGFPALLLMTTLLRLALAIASTKMILVHAHAGNVISAFGELVAGNNVAVGVVVFVVLCAIQFIVVVKGGDRIAEVAARFTLDGIPGRQMSIDADLRSNQITAEQAAQLRAGLERETYFYGSLDGAMKFVKGDAIASFVVALVNIVGGLAVGMLQRNLPFGEALQVYTILTIGDGLVSQIPSLIVSVAAGLLVTRVSPAGGATNLGTDLYRQLTLQPHALLMAGACCLALALIPGFPHLQFALLAALFGGLGGLLMSKSQRAHGNAVAPMPALARDGSRRVPSLLDDAETGTSAALRLRVGARAFDALHPEALNRVLAGLRHDLNARLGLPFPGLSCALDTRLAPERYIVDVDDVAFASGSLLPDHLLVSGRAADVTMDGVAGYRLGAEKAVWVATAAASRLDPAVFTTSTPEAALSAHLVEVFERCAPRLMGTQEARFLLDRIGGEFRELVAQIEQRVTTVQLAAVLRQLLQQHVSIRNLRGILEAVLRAPAHEHTLDRMVREVRIELGPQIVRGHANLDTWEIQGGVFEPEWEAELEASIQRARDGEPYCPLDFTQLDTVRRVLGQHARSVRVLVTSATLRPHIARVLQTLGIRMDVVAIEEIPRDVYQVRNIFTFSRS